MNAAHLHLLVNHVSLFAVAFGAAALAYSLLKPSRDLRVAASVLFLLAATFGWIAVESGEGAEEIVEHLPGVEESFIEEHEEAAEAAQASVFVLAICALFMEAVARWKASWLKKTQAFVLLIAVLSVGLIARTAQLGGQIRHTEIRLS